ncbi:exodeoxyribonuclease III [Candidatus Nomurabacteria bacterium RIFCSPLOWO2_02_FULL_42_17]|uniref:Exodeoxyribonuclease III n=2 Tax=Candidatus Nomuraibacteriota TaxID=1752729 RepID=A0A1F6WJ82_9BACT|nr:MAG: exodeoxyribonuclease III [Candidatus Nomurabacteria bacterium RIFCSPHIGHO2_02_FULL_42_24]OGI96844.1 MAG: exodeoxyribonuclease III [Candidatus Nomurabacteria bacterium RIFCSPLOWO2_02_FULL_42_17]
MKIISWNINGLRATYKSGHWADVLKFKPDILCLQETKAEPEQLSDEVRSPAGYFSYFSACKIKKGYSGVAIYSKIKPEKVEYGMGIPRFDDEGRMITARFRSQTSKIPRSLTSFTLINVYFPQGGRPGRLKYKLEFYDAFLKYVERLRKRGQVIFCGDINTAHKEIDLARPKENRQTTGFLPIERAWVDAVARAGWVDVFRHFYPNKTGAYTYWDQITRARDRNVGWRIDYFFATPNLLPRIKDVKILNEIYGSDHCPVEIMLDLGPLSD